MLFTATKGLPGCGKSTWADRVVMEDTESGIRSVRVNRDLLRIMLHFNRWSKEAERMTVAAQIAIIQELMDEKVGHIICDDTNLDPHVMLQLEELAYRNGYDFDVEDFTMVPLHVCIDRDADREGRARVGSEVILRMHNKYLA